jgi:hypothetical protein
MTPNNVIPSGGMITILDRRDEIYNYFHHNRSCQSFFFADAQKERYAAYYTSMYLIQDTTEGLLAHRAAGFSSFPPQAYIEFWGVMQAVIIQQDSISELYNAVTGTLLDTTRLNSWQSVRSLRNTCAGHPAKKDRRKGAPLTRTFTGRFFGGYSQLMYEQWEAQGSISHPRVRLGALIDEYVTEAESKMKQILDSMKVQWP